LGTVQKQEQSEPIRVLLAEGRRAPRRRAAAALRADERFELCACVADAPSAVAASLEHEPDVCVLDLGMPGGGIAAAREIAARLPGSRILMLADIPAGGEDFFAALRVRASGYLPKATQSEVAFDQLARERSLRSRPWAGGRRTKRDLRDGGVDLVRRLSRRGSDEKKRGGERCEERSSNLAAKGRREPHGGENLRSR
jgi:CheY-like chemotaxis protein